MAAHYVTPGLTTARQPVREMGGRAAELLHRRVGGPQGPVGQHVLPTQVVIRQSCGCPDFPARSQERTDRPLGQGSVHPAPGLQRSSLHPTST